MDKDLLKFLARPREKEIFLGDIRATLRLLPAARMLQLRQALAECSGDEESLALQGDAMVVAESLYVDGLRLFENAGQLLESCSVQQLQELTAQYVELEQSGGIGPNSSREELETLKKA